MMSWLLPSDEYSSWHTWDSKTWSEELTSAIFLNAVKRLQATTYDDNGISSRFEAEIELKDILPSSSSVRSCPAAAISSTVRWETSVPALGAIRAADDERLFIEGQLSGMVLAIDKKLSCKQRPV